MNTAHTPARRGDLAALITERVDTYIGADSVRRTVVELGVVTSVTRDGIVKAVLTAWGGSPVAVTPRQRVPLVSRDRFDAEAVRQAAAARAYPGTTQPRPFDSVDDAVSFVRPFVRAA